MSMDIKTIELKTSEFLTEAEESATPSAFYVIKKLSSFVFELIGKLEAANNEIVELQEQLDNIRDSV